MSKTTGLLWTGAVMHVPDTTSTCTTMDPVAFGCLRSLLAAHQNAGGFLEPNPLSAQAERKVRVTDVCQDGIHSSIAGSLVEVRTPRVDVPVAWICTGCGQTIYNTEWIISG